MTESTALYTRLAAPFEQTFTDVRGGVEITYISGEQVVSRLNEVLGVDGWTFRVAAHDIHAEADEAWVLGELVARFGESSVTRQQFGSNKIKRSRSTGAPLDIGFDLKAAATDAMKKCASLLGVGLYLSHKTPQLQQPRTRVSPAPQRTPPPQRQPAALPGPRPAATAATAATPVIKCRYVDADGVVCDQPLEEVTDNGLLWTAIDLANASQKQFRKPYCWEHYRSSLPAAKAS